MKALIDLQPCDCRWPIDNADGRFFCGEPIARKSYCSHHYALAYPAAAQKTYALPPARNRIAETKSGETHKAPDESPEAEPVDCFDVMERADG